MKNTSVSVTTADIRPCRENVIQRPRGIVRPWLATGIAALLMLLLAAPVHAVAAETAPDGQTQTAPEIPYEPIFQTIELSGDTKWSELKIELPETITDPANHALHLHLTQDVTLTIDREVEIRYLKVTGDTGSETLTLTGTGSLHVRHIAILGNLPENGSVEKIFEALWPHPAGTVESAAKKEDIRVTDKMVSLTVGTTPGDAVEVNLGGVILGDSRTLTVHAPATNINIYWAEPNSTLLFDLGAGNTLTFPALPNCLYEENRGNTVSTAECRYGAGTFRIISGTVNPKRYVPNSKYFFYGVLSELNTIEIDGSDARLLCELPYVTFAEKRHEGSVGRMLLTNGGIWELKAYTGLQNELVFGEGGGTVLLSGNRNVNHDTLIHDGTLGLANVTVNPGVTAVIRRAPDEDLTLLHDRTREQVGVEFNTATDQCTLSIGTSATLTIDAPLRSSDGTDNTEIHKTGPGELILTSDKPGLNDDGTVWLDDRMSKSVLYVKEGTLTLKPRVPTARFFKQPWANRYSSNLYVYDGGTLVVDDSAGGSSVMLYGLYMSRNAHLDICKMKQPITLRYDGFGGYTYGPDRTLNFNGILQLQCRQEQVPTESNPLLKLFRTPEQYEKTFNAEQFKYIDVIYSTGSGSTTHGELRTADSNHTLGAGLRAKGEIPSAPEGALEINGDTTWSKLVKDIPKWKGDKEFALHVTTDATLTFDVTKKSDTETENPLAYMNDIHKLSIYADPGYTLTLKKTGDSLHFLPVQKGNSQEGGIVEIYGDVRMDGDEFIGDVYLGGEPSLKVDPYSRLTLTGTGDTQGMLETHLYFEQNIFQTTFRIIWEGELRYQPNNPTQPDILYCNGEVNKNGKLSIESGKLFFALYKTNPNAPAKLEISPNAELTVLHNYDAAKSDTDKAFANTRVKNYGTFNCCANGSLPPMEGGSGTLNIRNAAQLPVPIERSDNWNELQLIKLKNTDVRIENPLQINTICIEEGIRPTIRGVQRNEKEPRVMVDIRHLKLRKGSGINFCIKKPNSTEGSDYFKWEEKLTHPSLNILESLTYTGDCRLACDTITLGDSLVLNPPANTTDSLTLNVSHTLTLPKALKVALPENASMNDTPRSLLTVEQEQYRTGTAAGNAKTMTAVIPDWAAQGLDLGRKTGAFCLASTKVERDADADPDYKKYHENADASKDLKTTLKVFTHTVTIAPIKERPPAPNGMTDTTPYTAESVGALVTANGGNVPTKVTAKAFNPQTGETALSVNEVNTVLALFDVAKRTNEAGTVDVTYEFGISGIRPAMGGLVLDCKVRRSPDEPAGYAADAAIEVFLNDAAEAVQGAYPCDAEGNRVLGPQTGSVRHMWVPLPPAGSRAGYTIKAVKQ